MNMYFSKAVRSLLIGLAVTAACPADAQNLKTSEVPKNVTEKFHAQYPKAKSISWEKVGADYVASYKDDQSSTRTTYTENGKWLRTAIFVEQEDLPMNVFNVVKKEYPNYDEISYSYLMKEEKDLQYYLVGVTDRSKNVLAEMRFTLIGNFTRKTEKPLSDEVMASVAKQKEVASSGKEVKEKGESKKKAAAKKADENLISEDKVPAVVMKAFKKRMMNASEVRWFLRPGDSVYTVKCVVREQNTLGKFTDKGAWISSRTELEKDRVPSAVYKTIGQFYPSYKFVSAGKEIRSDKQDFFAVEIIEAQYSKDGDITTLYLDKSARIKYIEEPALKTSSASNMTAEEEKEERKLEKEFAKDQQLDIFPVKSISADEIPNSIHKWTSTYYPEYIYKNIRYEEDEEFEEEGNIYIILIQRPGVGQPYATVYFTRTGKFLKLVDDFRTEEEIEAQMTAKKTPPVVPMNVAAAFKTRITDAVDVRWEKDDEDNWVANYTDKRDNVKQTAYAPDASWVYTRTEIPASKVPTTIRNYVAGNFPNTEIRQCWQATDGQNKLYYVVNLYSKKTKLDFDMQFTQAGKPME